MKTNSNFFCLTPIFRVHSVLFFRVTKNRYKNIEMNIEMKWNEMNIEMYFKKLSNM